MANKKNITRLHYFEKVEPFMNSQLIKILVGLRRVGKSYILQQLMDKIMEDNPQSNIIYINKEDLKFDFIKNYDDLYNYIEIHKKPKLNYLFIDEIQDIDEFEKTLRHYSLDETFDIYVTGSNANLLSGEIATYLSGRYISIRIFSLSYKEFLLFHELEDSNEAFQKFIEIGGMPHLIKLKEEKGVYFEYLKNVFDSIILRDIVARYKIRDINFLNDMLLFLSDNLGSLISANKISDYLKSQKITSSTRKALEYLDYICSVFFVDSVHRTEIIGKKIFEIGEKFYFEDIGMRNYLKPYSINDIGKILENVVYHHLKICDYQVFIGKFGDKEIDFVAKKNDSIIYIQVTYVLLDESTIEREFGNLLKIKDNFRKIVISMDQFIGSNYKGIEHISIRNFLMNFE